MTAADHHRCTATNRAGKRCGRYRTPGTTVCPSHGSKAKQVQAAAARRVAQAQAIARVKVAAEVRGPLTLPQVYTEMLRTASVVVAWRDELQDRLADLQGRYGYVDGIGSEKVRADVVLFERSLDRAAKVLDLIGRLDLDSRIRQISTQQSELIAGAVKRARDAVPHLTEDQRAAFDAAMAAEFRALAAPEHTGSVA